MKKSLIIIIIPFLYACASHMALVQQYRPDPRKLSSGHSVKSNFTPEYRPEKSFSIMGAGKLDAETMTAYLLKHNTGLNPDFVSRLARAYIREAAAEGVNHDIAFARFGNQVKADQHNFAGIGATDDGAMGNTFPSMEIGVRVHIQHLKAYASDEDLNHELVDPRFRYVRRKSAPFVDDLAGKWASDPRYGEKIRGILGKLYER
jgi:hypothetical protein